MQLLSEVKAPDGAATAKIYNDDGTYFTEFYVNGALQRSFNSVEGTPLSEVEYFARQWVGSVQQLNG